MSNTEKIAAAPPRTASLFDRVVQWFAGKAMISPKDVDAFAIEVAGQPDTETVATAGDIPQDEKIATLETLTDAEFLRIVAIVARAYGVVLSRPEVSPESDESLDVGFGRLVLIDRIAGLVAVADQHVAPPAVVDTNELKRERKLRDEAQREAREARAEMINAARHLGRALNALRIVHPAAIASAAGEIAGPGRVTLEAYIDDDDQHDD